MQEGWVVNRASVWICDVSHRCPRPAPGPRMSGHTAAGSHSPAASKRTGPLSKLPLGRFPCNFHQEENPGIKASKTCQGHQVPLPRPGHQHLLPSSTLGLLLKGYVLCPAPLHGGYLGTGQSGKHLIATLRRGDVRNKGNCVGSWELPFPGNSGSQTKP